MKPDTLTRKSAGASPNTLFKKLPLFLILTLLAGSAPAAFQAQTSGVEEGLQALEQSFLERDLKAVKPFLSPEMQIGPLPSTNTAPILRSLLAKFPSLREYQILEKTEGKVFVRFKFDQLGVKDSFIHFNKAGQICRIDFLDEIIKEQIRAQQILDNSVKVPQPGPLAEQFPYQTIHFAAKDGLPVSGNLYHLGRGRPVILLCHQANYNKYEYADIAPKLNQMGYNVLAIDQRSGGDFAGKSNETLLQARAAGINDIDFLDAELDIVAAVDYLNARYQTQVILWGSSYSSALALFIAQSHPGVKAAIAFSPGNYFGDRKPMLKEVVSRLEKPVFIASSQEEAEIIEKTLGRVLRGGEHQQFIPASSGFHGSKALWEGQEGAEEYWSAVSDFLNMIR